MGSASSTRRHEPYVSVRIFGVAAIPLPRQRIWEAVAMSGTIADAPERIELGNRSNI